MAYPISTVRLRITAILLLSEYTFGSTAEQGHFMTHAADNGPVLYDEGRLLLCFCIATFVILNLAFMSYKLTAGASGDKFEQHDTDPLDLILLTCAQCLYYGVCGLCTAVAACWRGLIHIFTMKPNCQLMPSPALPSSASAPPTYPPPMSSSLLPPSPERLLPDPLLAASSSFNDTSGASQTMATLGQWNSLLTTQNCWLSSHLKGVERSNTHLQKQLQGACAALLTTRSNAQNAGALAAQAHAQKERYKAALREMKACVEEMYTQGELAIERILNEKKTLSEELQQERASRVQEVQTLMNQINSLTAHLSSTQGEFFAERNQLAKHNNELRQERDLARSAAMAVAVALREEIGKWSLAERAEAMREAKAFLAALPPKKAPAGPVPCPTTALPCSTSSTSKSAMPVALSASLLQISDSKMTAPTQGSSSGLNRPPMLAVSVTATDLTTRKPFQDSTNQAATIPAAATKSMRNCRSLSSSTASRETEACGLSPTLGAKENVQPVPCSVSFSSRQRSSLDTRKFTNMPSIRSPAGAVTSPVRRQSVSPTTATEAQRHEMRYTDDRNQCHAQLSRSAPTGQGASGTNSGNSTHASVTAAKAARSAAGSIALLPTATEANDIAKSSCTVADVQYDMAANMTANMAATVKDDSNCHVPPVKNTQSIITATRLDETSSSLMTLAHYHRGRKHSN